MTKIYKGMILVLEALVAAGSIALAFLEKGVANKPFYFLAGLLLLPVLPIRRKIEKKLHIKRGFVLPAIGLVLLIAAIMLTPIS